MLRQSSEQTLLDTIRPRVLAVFDAIAAELRGVGLTLESPSLETSRLSVERDERDGSDVVVAFWQALDGDRVGGCLFRPDGGCFADVDVLARHPRVPRLLIESVSVVSSGAELTSRMRCRAV